MWIHRSTERRGRFAKMRSWVSPRKVSIAEPDQCMSLANLQRPRGTQDAAPKFPHAHEVCGGHWTTRAVISSAHPKQRDDCPRQRLVEGALLQVTAGCLRYFAK